MIHNYSTWNYWFGFWMADENTEFSMMRTPQTFNMIDMLKNFMDKKPPMNFNPDMLMIGRVADKTEGMTIYDNNDVQAAFKLMADQKLVDVCRTALVLNPTPQEAAQINRMSNAGMFDQLEQFLKDNSNKKKKKRN